MNEFTRMDFKLTKGKLQPAIIGQTKDKVLKVLGIAWNTVTDDIQILTKQINSMQLCHYKQRSSSSNYVYI